MEIYTDSGSHGLTVEPRNNRLLGALPDVDLQRWRPNLELVHMPAGMTLRRCVEHSGHVYFPTTASVSMLHITRGGDSVEVVAVGNEGMVGIPVITGSGPTPGDAVVRTGGHGFRLAGAWLHREFHACEAVMRLLLRYMHALMTHTSQAAVCNQHHSLEQRLCRCFLSSLDSSNGAPLNLTHEGLAGMLGVRREGVTGAALKLQRAGLINYARGRVAVLDRSGLEALSCECYRVVKAEYERLAPGWSGIPASSRSMNFPTAASELPRAASSLVATSPQMAGRRTASAAHGALAG